MLWRNFAGNPADVILYYTCGKVNAYLFRCVDGPNYVPPKRTAFSGTGRIICTKEKRKKMGENIWHCSTPCLCSRHCVTLTVTDTIAARIEKSVSLARELQKRVKHVPNRGCREIGDATKPIPWTFLS